jgi:hypothetical protein
VPRLVIGLDESDPLFQVSDALILDDELLVAEQSTGRLRFYGMSGELRRSVGGSGEGPGEFRRLGWLQRVGDRFFAYDLALRRLSEYELDGTHVRDVRIEEHPPLRFPYAFGVFADRSILVATYAPTEGLPQQGTFREKVVLLRYGEDGTFQDSLGTYSGTDDYVEPWGRGGQRTARLPFGRQTIVTVFGNRYVVAENDGPDMPMFDETGSRLGVFSSPLSPERLAVEPSDVATARERFARFDTPERKLGETFDRMPLPDTFPIYGWSGAQRLKLMRSVAAGEIWIINFGGVRDSRPRWSVFDTTGTYRGDVIAPEEVELLDATADVAAVLHWDDTDVETVQLRSIQREVE